MREILFRAKSILADNPSDTSSNYWIEGSLVHQTEHYGDPVDVYHIVKPGNFHCDYYDSEEVWPETVGQYTGVKDYYGKKIFEGDIVICSMIYETGCYPHTVTEVAEVRYTTDGFYPLYRAERKHLAVIGNIHDNPELLKGGDK